MTAAAWLTLGLHELTDGGLSYGEDVPFLHSVGDWAVMVGAMMGLGLLPAVRHVTNSSLAWRRPRAAVEFVATYAILWAAVGLVAIAVASAIPALPIFRSFALGGAALWQLTPLKQQFLRNCHRAVPLPATGRPATAGCVRFGVVHGTACVGSCWCLMTFMVLAPRPHIAWGALLTVIALVEQNAAKPRRAARQAAVILSALAIGSGLAGVQ